MSAGLGNCRKREEKRQNMKGLIHIYCGDGKGKSTAAAGLAVRAAGRGLKVLMVRFLKTDDSGEVPVLQGIPGVTLVPCDKTFGFTFRMTPEEKKEAAAYSRQKFLNACRQAGQEGKNQVDLLILDEIMAAVNTGMVSQEDVLRFLEEKPEHLEVVLTGRNPSERMVELADYVSEIRAVKHPFTEGISAREGIEF